MSTVTINGNTYSDDANPETGLAAGGHRTRLVPMLADAVVLAQQVANDAGAATAAKEAAAGSATAAATSAGSAGASAGNAAQSAGAAAGSAASAAATLAAVVQTVTGGMGSTTPAANKMPVADSSAQIDWRWLGNNANPDIRPSLRLDFVNRTRLDSRVVFSRPSTATRINPHGIIEVAAAGMPRIDYDPVTRAVRGLLIEEQRTRLNTVAAAPTVPETIAVTAQTYTVSFYGTGAVLLSGAHDANIVGTGAFPGRTVYTFTPPAGSLTLTPSGSVLDLQVEAGAFETSVIRGSEGSQVTRAADVATVNTLSPWFNTVAGTFLLEIERAVFGGTDFQIGVAGSGTQRMYHTVNTNTNSTEWRCNAGDGMVHGASQTGRIERSAVFYDSLAATLNFGGSLRGAAVVAGTRVLPNIAAFNIVYLGSTAINASAGRRWIRALRYYPTRINNAGLQALSA